MAKTLVIIATLVHAMARDFVTTNSQKKRRTMINQVDFEGYLTRDREYRERCFMRLATHRPANPPDVQGADMPVTDVLLARQGFTHFFDGEGFFDEATVG
jgi:hypothetical protein